MLSNSLPLILKMAWRSARKDKRQSFTIVATIGLAVCGIAAAGALVDALWIRPLPFIESERLAVIFTLPPNADTADRNPLRSSDFVELRDRLKASMVLAGIAARERAVRVNVEPAPFRVGHVSADFFSVLQVQPMLGRVFSTVEDEDREPLVVLGFGTWQAAFGGDTGVVGRRLLIDGEPHTIIGVMPRGFDAVFAPSDLWVPLGVSHSHQPVPAAAYIIGVARLLDDMTLAGADAATSAVMTQLNREHPVANHGWRAGAVSVREFHFGDQRRVGLILFAGAVLLFAVAALNVLNATLVSALSRSGELLTARALGASVRHLTLQQVGLTLGLVGAGTAAGLWLAQGLLALLEALNTDGMRQLGMPAVHLRTSILASLAVAVVGAAAGVIAMRRVLQQALVSTRTRVTGGIRDRHLRRALSAVQVAVVVVLIAGAISLGAALYRSIRLAPGFRTEDVLATQLRMPLSLYPSAERRTQALVLFLERARALPGVLSAAATTNAFQPGAAIATLIDVEGRPTPDRSPYMTQVRYVSGEYFDTLRIPIVTGRFIEARDTASAPMAAVVSHALARRLWGTDDVVGRRVTRRAGDFPAFTVVGVVGDVSDVRVGQPAEGILYLAYAQINFEVAPVSLLVRTTGRPEALAPAVRRAILAVNPDQPIYRVAGLDDFVSASLSPQRFRTAILVVTATMALLLAAAGIHAVVGRSIVERVREIAIRRALGARRTDLCIVAFTDAGVALLVGSAVGLPLAMFLLTNSSRLLPEVQPADPGALGGAVLVVAVTVGSVVLALLPAVLRVDAAETLRNE